MSRKKKSNDIYTKNKHIRFGKRVFLDNKPVALIGPNKNQDTLSLQEMAVELYGPGTQCYVIPGNDAIGC